MTYPLATARPGERWVVRVRTPDGSATDLVGWVDAVDPDGVALTGADRVRHRVERSLVLAARRTPAAPGGPDPRRAEVAEVERHSLVGWLAESAPLGEWTLRAGGGFTGRANSVHAVGDPGVPIAAAAERVVAYAAEHGIPPAATVVTGSAEERALLALGWVEAPLRAAEVLVTRLADLLGETAPPAGVRVVETLEPVWAEAYRGTRPPPADPSVATRILAGHPPHAFASVTDGGVVVAIGRGHVSGAWTGMAAVWTDPSHRRAGHATRVMAALGHWAARLGARFAYVQVDAGNSAATTAYARLGFRPHHAYRYLRPPP